MATAKKKPAQLSKKLKSPPSRTTISRPQTSKSASVEVVAKPQLPEKKKPVVSVARVMADHKRRTCIELSRNDQHVQFVALDIENGLNIGLILPTEFDHRFTPLGDYPAEKAAKLYVEYARGIGATEQVMQSLGKLTHVTNEDIEMATKKKAARTAPIVKSPGGKPAKSKKAAPAKKAAAAAPAKKAADGDKASRGPTAAKLFQQLVLEGKGGKCVYTDDEIFAKVKKEFGLDESKRSYVKWYRNYLVKQGETVPTAKE